MSLLTPRLSIRNNPSEYWKKNIQKAIKAHQDRSDRVLGHIYADPEDRDLSGLDLSGANLASADLRGADLTGAELTRAILIDARMPDGSIHK